MAKLSVSNLNFGYDKTLILRNLHHDFQEGKFNCILGANGSGKSTLLKCLNQILTIKEGRILYNKMDISRFRLNEIAQCIAYVPQSELSTFSATVFDTILLGRRPYIRWNPSKYDLEVVAEVMHQLKLEDLSLKRMNTLSGGQRQSVIIARALAQRPQIILLDEPTANLDLNHQVEVMNRLAALSKQGITIIMAIHDLNMALQYGHDFLLLKYGTKLASGNKHIISSSLVEELYDTKVKIIEDHGEKYILPKTIEYEN